MSGEDKRFRVVALGVAPGQQLSRKELAGSISQTHPLRADARLALEAGRSAVVQVADTEAQARRTASLLIKLGAEIRIEPEGGGPGGLELGTLDLEGDDGPDLEPASPGPGGHFGDESPTQPPPGQAQARLPPLPGMLVDRPPRDDIAPSVSPTRRLSTARIQTDVPPPELPTPGGTDDPSADDPSPADEDTGIPAEAAADDGSAPPLEEATAGGSKSMLVRCPAHGLLYDANEAAGCSRCLGAAAARPFRLAPGLRKRPRLWLTLGLGLGLLLGALPAALYASSVKSGALYERRIEADAIRTGRIGSARYNQEYDKARRKVITTRSRGIAVSALIWIGISALLMFLWYRFV